MKETKAVVTVVGKDSVGVLANISTAVAAAGANVINMQQSVVVGYFNLIMIIEISQATQSIEEMRESIASAVPNTQVHVMHENIFLSMHTI